MWIFIFNLSNSWMLSSPSPPLWGRPSGATPPLPPPSTSQTPPGRSHTTARRSRNKTAVSKVYIGRSIRSSQTETHTKTGVSPGSSWSPQQNGRLTSPTTSAVALTLWYSCSLAASWVFWTTSSFTCSKNRLLARSSRSAISSNSIQSWGQEAEGGEL